MYFINTISFDPQNYLEAPNRELVMNREVTYFVQVTQPAMVD